MPPREDSCITVLITHLGDPRVVQAARSAVAQDVPPLEVLVADGGTPRPALDRIRGELAALDPTVRLEFLPGSVAGTRNLALPLVQGEVVAFLDADETAPPQWLGALSGPILEGRADFTGGPTRPGGTPKSPYEAYVNRFDEWLYNAVVAQDITFLPMGNSAWRTSVLREIGGFDERLNVGGEDYDVTLRAMAAGRRGEYVPGAWVYHDQSHLNSLAKLVRRRYRYTVGAVMAYRKNGVLRSKGRRAALIRLGHPLDYLDVFIKPLALVHGSLAWGLRGD